MFYLTESLADSGMLDEDEDFLDHHSDEFGDKHYSFNKDNSLLKSQSLGITAGEENDSFFQDEGENEMENPCPLLRSIEKQSAKYLVSETKMKCLESISDPGFVDSDINVSSTAFLNRSKIRRPHSACQFGSVRVRDLLNNSLDPLPKKHTCVCSRPKYAVTDSLTGWEPAPKTHHRHSKNGKHRKYPPGSSNPFSRLYSFTETKDISYDFHHYNETKRYIEQYRMCHTVGDVHRKALSSSGEGSDLYVPKLKSNICAIAENCDFLAILSLDRDSSSSTENLSNKSAPPPNDSVETQEVKLNRTKERPVNLAPVREFSVPDLGNAKGAKKLYIALSQYLNLVVPKTSTLPEEKNTEKSPRIHNAFISRRRRCRFKTSLKHDGSTQVAESPIRRNGSASSLKIKQRQNSTKHVDLSCERAGSADLPKPKPPSIIRLVATSHGNREKTEQKQKHPPTPTSQGVLYVGSTVNKEPESAKPPFSSKRHPLNSCQMHSRRFKCCERLHEILSHSTDDKREERKEFDRFPKKIDSHEKITENAMKPERILPMPTKALGVQGKNYKSEEQLTVIYRLQKEKMRRTNTIAEIQI